jgi:PAS domain S-box-containing protein
VIWISSAALILSLIFVIFLLLKIKKLYLYLEMERIKGDLASRKEFFETLIDAVADPIFVKNNQHQWIYGNKAFSKILNMDLKDYLGKSDYDIFPKEQADIFWAKDRETLDKMIMIENEEFIMMKDEVRTIVTKKTPVSGLEGGTVLIGVIRDITESKRQNEIIANLYQLIESSSDLYCFCDLKGKPSFINRHGIKMGFSTNLAHFSNFLSQQLDLDALEKELNRSHEWEGEVELLNLNTNEPVPYWLKIFYVMDENEKPKSISLVGTNIQERKETALKIFNASKMASLGEMAGGIAHEINNPLAIISGKAEQIKKFIHQDPIERDKIYEAMEKIEDTSFRISKIIKGLRSFSRSGEQDPSKEVLVRDLIDETLDLCRERMKSENITLIQESDNTLTLNCRPTQIQQVLINLLNNAIDAIKGHKEPWIKIRSEKIGSQIILTVTDSGTGIEPKLIEKIMNPFFTTKGVGKGTGLGLPISKRIMEAHGGKLVYLPENPHTSFSLIFNT